MWVKSRDDKNKMAINLDTINLIKCRQVLFEGKIIYTLEFHQQNGDRYPWNYESEEMRTKDYNRIVGRNLLSLE